MYYFPCQIIFVCFIFKFKALTISKEMGPFFTNTIEDSKMVVQNVYLMAGMF